MSIKETVNKSTKIQWASAAITLITGAYAYFQWSEKAKAITSTIIAVLSTVAFVNHTRFKNSLFKKAHQESIDNIIRQFQGHIQERQKELEQDIQYYKTDLASWGAFKKSSADFKKTKGIAEKLFQSSANAQETDALLDLYNKHSTATQELYKAIKKKCALMIEWNPKRIEKYQEVVDEFKTIKPSRKLGKEFLRTGEMPESDRKRIDRIYTPPAKATTIEAEIT